jgi:oligopeptide transport system substrate-binding protein
MRCRKLYKVAGWALFIILAVFLVSCQKKVETESIFNEAIYSDPSSFDPRAQVDSETYGIMYTMYNTLVELDDSMKIIPALASSWETDDFQTWRFFLRKDVYFHEDPCFKNDKKTRLLNASDIEYSLNRAIQPGGVGGFVLTDIVKGASEVNEGKAKTASGIKVLDEHTIEITLLKPYQKFLERLATPFLFIVAREAVQQYGEEFGRHAVGTGPYSLAKIDPGKAVYLKRNNLYWKKDAKEDKLPYLDGLKFRIFHDPQVALSEFKNGNLDAIDVPAVLASTIIKNDRLTSQYEKYQMLETTAIDVHYYAFRMDKEPFKNNLALREALNYAVDKEKITNILMNGLAEPATGVLPPGVYPDFPRSRVYEYDPDLARKKLVEAGYPEGKNLPGLTLGIDDKATTEVVAQYVQSALKDIGVRLKLKKMHFNTLLGEIGQGNLDFYYLYWEGTDPNAEIFMVQFKSDLLPEKGGYNFGHYSNTEADSLFDQAVGELDTNKSKQLWVKLNSLIVKDAPWIFLYHTKRVRLLQPNITGYENNPLQIRRYTLTKKAAD